MPQYALPQMMIEIRFPGFVSTAVDYELPPEFPELMSTNDQVTVARFVLSKEPRAMSYRRFVPTGWNKKDYVDKGTVVIGPATIRYRDEILSGQNQSEEVLRSNVKTNGWKAIIVTHGMHVPYDPGTDQLVYT